MPRNPTFLIHLQAQNYYELGFLPKGALTEYLKHRRCIFAYENAEPCGYLLYKRLRHPDETQPENRNLRIVQAVISFDLRRVQHATNAVNQLIQIAKSGHFLTLDLWCGSKLEANRFWRAIGFTLDGLRRGGRRKHPVHYHYTMEITPSTTALWIPNRTRKTGIPKITVFPDLGDRRRTIIERTPRTKKMHTT